MLRCSGGLLQKPDSWGPNCYRGVVGQALDVAAEGKAAKICGILNTPRAEKSVDCRDFQA